MKQPTTVDGVQMDWCCIGNFASVLMGLSHPGMGLSFNPGDWSSDESSQPVSLSNLHIVAPVCLTQPVLV